MAVMSPAQKNYMPLAYNQLLNTVNTKLKILFSYQDAACFAAQT
jgi:hypothetical protein